MEEENNNVKAGWKMNFNPMDIILIFILAFFVTGYALWLFGAF